MLSVEGLRTAVYIPIYFLHLVRNDSSSIGSPLPFIDQCLNTNSKVLFYTVAQGHLHRFVLAECGSSKFIKNKGHNFLQRVFFCAVNFAYYFCNLKFLITSHWKIKLLIMDIHNSLYRENTSIFCLTDVGTLNAIVIPNRTEHLAKVSREEELQILTQGVDMQERK